MPAFLTHFVFDVLAGCTAVDADRQHHGFPVAVFYVPAHGVFDVFGFQMAALIAAPPSYFPHLRFFDFAFSFHGFYSVITAVPNQSPEPTTIGAFRDSARVAGCWMSIVRGGSASDVSQPE
jgi:hypothetical protein